MYQVGDIVVCVRFKRMNSTIPVLILREKQPILDIVHGHLKVCGINNEGKKEAAYYHPSWFAKTDKISEIIPQKRFGKSEMRLYSMRYSYQGKKTTRDSFIEKYYSMGGKLSPLSTGLANEILKQDI